MEQSLKANELRPFDYVKNYAQEVQQVGYNDLVTDGLKILSASPFRATVKVD